MQIMNDIDTDNDKMRQDCLNSAFHSFGYAYIYSLRGIYLRKKIKFNTFLGIIVPLLVGGIVSTYSTSESILQIILYVAGFFSLIQLVLSALSLSYNWEDNYSYYLESSNDNNTLSNEFKQLYKYTPKRINELKKEKDKLDFRHKMRSDLDSKYPLKEEEKRKGMRYSLREFKRSCSSCGKIPTDMKSTTCGVCGNFK